MDGNTRMRVLHSVSPPLWVIDGKRHVSVSNCAVAGVERQVGNLLLGDDGACSALVDSTSGVGTLHRWFA
jgi:hypothetical protein